MMRRPRLLLLAISLTTLPALADTPLGRLFFTPAERASRDQGTPTAAPQAPASVQGIVLRNGRPAAVWVDGELRDDIPVSGLRAGIRDAEGERRWQAVGQAGDDTPLDIRRHRR